MEVAAEQVVAVVVEVAAVVPASSVVRRVTGPEIVQTQAQEGAGVAGAGAVEGIVAAPHKDTAEAMEGGVWVLGQGQALLKVGPVTSVVSQVTGPTLAPTDSSSVPERYTAFVTCRVQHSGEPRIFT